MRPWRAAPQLLRQWLRSPTALGATLAFAWSIPAARAVEAPATDARLKSEDPADQPRPLISEATPTAAEPEPKPRELVADAPKSTKPAEVDDGMPDISNFLDTKFGFLPIVRPITEPAVGYGAMGGLMFISQPLGSAAQGLGRPSITGAGGFGTENGSRGGFALDLRYFGDTRVQTMVAVIGASVNLDYYGTGDDSALHDNPLRYNLQPLGGVAQAKYRFGDTRLWAGLGYSFASTQVSFATPPDSPELPKQPSRSNVGMLRASTSYDTRDNFFTPLRGSFVEATFQLSQTWLGSDNNFERLTVTGIQYFPLPLNLYLGLRADGGASFGDAPFYMRPSISMRGVAAMRYQGEEIAQGEIELRWQFYGRWSVLGFVGAGGAWNHFEKLDNSQGVIAAGGGFRYELARRYGLHLGIDVAGSRDTGAFYLQVGSAWMRP